MVITGRREFYKNLTYDTDTRLLDILKRDIVKVTDDSPAQGVEFEQVHVLGGYIVLYYLQPFAVYFVDASRNCFIRAHAIYAAHEDIAKLCADSGTEHQLCVQMETGITLDTAKIQGDNRYLFHSGFCQGTADKAYIVGSTTAAACLGHDDGCLIQIIFTGKQCFHDLTDYQQGRIAGIVIYIFQSNVHRVLIVVIKNYEIVAAGIECRL